MTLVEIISLVVGSGIALRVVEHYLTRRNTQKIATKSHIENIDLAGETWQKVVDRLEARIEKLMNQLNVLQDENTKLREEIYALRTELAALKTIQQKCDKYEKQVTKLQEKISRYERLLNEHDIDY